MYIRDVFLLKWHTVRISVGLPSCCGFSWGFLSLSSEFRYMLRQTPSSSLSVHHLSSFIYSGVAIATGCGLDDRGVKNFLFSTSRPALGSTQPHIQWVPGAFSPDVKRSGREVHSSSTTAEIKNCGAIHPLLHTPSWRSA
jgi:hypothetical protein